MLYNIYFIQSLHLGLQHINPAGRDTVEPLLKNTPNIGHLSIKDKLCGPVHGNTILPLKEDDLPTTVKLAGPKVSVI